MAQEPGLSSADTLLAVTTLSFDIAALELYLPLIVGARVVVVPREIAVDGSQLANLLTTSRATVMQATPATWQMLLEAGWTGKADLKVLSGGEAIALELAQQLLACCAELWNMYGPTETTIWSTIHRMTADDMQVLVGRPIANTQVYILDQQQNPTPIGVPGELYIGGDGLARGYLNRPELTAERFVEISGKVAKWQSVHDTDPATLRLYCTGDLARYLPDGRIECLGRLDHQVKVRGFRIELGEIEAHLLPHPAVAQCVVVAREDSPGDKRLVAYLVAAQSVLPPTSELRAFLQRQLPDHMIPSAFVQMDTLPLTPNRKVDRKALPAPDRVGRADNEDAFVAPRDQLERQLANIWERVLRRRPIGVHDNFFALGGHSLLAVRLFAQVERLIGPKLPLAVLFQAPTIAQLADIVRDTGWSPPKSSLVPIQPGGAKPPFFCVHGEGGHVLELRALAQRLGSEQPFYGLQAHGLVDPDFTAQSIEDMAARYVREIRTLQPDGPYYIGGNCFGGIVAYEMAQQLTAAGQEVAALVLIHSESRNYRKFLPHVTPFRYRLLHVFYRCQVELSNLSSRSPGKQAAYLAARARRMGELAVIKLHHAFRFPLALIGSGRQELAFAATVEEVRAGNRNAFHTYAPRPYQGDVTLIRASGRKLGIQPDPLLGWGDVTAGIEVIEIPGFQENIVEEPRVAVLGAQLAAVLARSQSRVEQ